MNYDDERRVAQIAARVTGEQIRNLVRGTGGQIVPTLSMRTATCTTIGAPGDQVMLRVDGDSIDDLDPNDPTSTNLVPAINASGAILGDGDRVMVTWVPPHGVYVTQQLRNGIAGDWTPVLLGPSAANGTATGVGHYVQTDRRMHAWGTWTFQAGAAMGTGAQIGGLPKPVGYWNGDVHLGRCVFIDAAGTTLCPGTWLVTEGLDFGQVMPHDSSAAYARLVSATATVPFTFAAGARIVLDYVYDVN
jgi:hypothetical protein